MNEAKLLILKLEEKHCYKCEHFYEGFICGFEISANKDDKIQDILIKRKDVCSLDNEPLEIRRIIYPNI